MESDFAAVAFHDVADEGEAKAGALDVSIFRRGDAVETIKDFSLFGGGDAEAKIPDFEGDVGAVGLDAEANLAGGAGVFHGVGEEVENGLFEGIAIGVNGLWGVVEGGFEGVSGSFEHGTGGGEDGFDEWLKSDGRERVGFAVSFDAGELEYVVDEAAESLGFVLHGVEVVLAGCGVEVRGHPHTFDKNAERCEGSAEFVGNGGDELGAEFGKLLFTAGVAPEENAAEESKRNGDGEHGGESLPVGLDGRGRRELDVEVEKGLAEGLAILEGEIGWGKDGPEFEWCGFIDEIEGIAPGKPMAGVERGKRIFGLEAGGGFGVGGVGYAGETKARGRKKLGVFLGGFQEIGVELGSVDMGESVGGNGDAVFVGDSGGEGGEDSQVGGVPGLDS